jgi:ACS family D-galactonate transporter-like MFS transporter
VANQQLPTHVFPVAGTGVPSRRALGMVVLLMATVFTSHFNRVSIATAGDTRIMKQYEIPPPRMGMVYSAYLLVYTICMIPGGLFIDRYGARAAMIVLGFGSALFVGLTGVVGLSFHTAGGVFIGLLIVRALLGVVSAPLHPGAARAVGNWIAPGGRSLTNGLVNGSALLGIAVTPLLFGALIDRFDSWPVAFLITAGVSAALALIWLVFAADHPDGSKQSAPIGDWGPIPMKTSWFDVLRHRSLVLLTLSYGTVSYFQYLFFYWMNFYFQTVLKLPEGTSRKYAAIPPLAMAAGMPLGGWLSDRLERASGSVRTRRIVPMAGMTAGALLLILGAFAQSPEWIVFWFALALGAVGAAEGPFWATVVELGGRRGGSAAALFNTGGNAGGLLAPIVTPLVGQYLGWGYAVGLGGVICLLGVVLWFWIDPAEQPLEE